MVNNSKNYLEWFRKAEEDEETIKTLLEKGGVLSLSVACFHSQQMVEKYLKGLLVFHSNDFLKIHDLIELETLLKEKLPRIIEFHEDLKSLNRYYIETRYPGDYPEFTLNEAKQAFEAAKTIKDFVLKEIHQKE